MIKNVVFDFGQVLVHFEPKYMVEKYVDDMDDSLLLQSVVFDRLYWDRLDLGTISDDQVISACRERLPERLHAVAEKIFRSWIYNIPEIDGMRALIKELKELHGVGLYLLSNISKTFIEHSSEFSILSYFDKCIMSAKYGVVKPSCDIFTLLCSECSINKEESIFIDDSPKNIEGAKAFGLHTYLFDGNAEKLRAHLLKLLSV